MDTQECYALVLLRSLAEERVSGVNAVKHDANHVELGWQSGNFRTVALYASDAVIKVLMVRPDSA